MPDNTWGYQYAHTGNAYAGIYTYINGRYSPADSSFRDYLQDTLIAPLSSGIKYYVTFYVNLGDSCKYACNDIGVYFSDSTLNFNSRTVKPYLTPQVTNPLTNQLTDKINWMKISGNFVAKGGERYLVIGNFKPSYMCDTIFVNSKGSSAHVWTHSYYYIDDVIVSADSNYADSITAVNEVSVKNEELRVFPNPSHGVFTIEQRAEKQSEVIEVYNMLGEKVYSSGFLILNSKLT